MNFTDNEIEVLKQIIHLAVMARGMEVAESAVVLTKKLDAMQRVQQAQERQAQLKQGNTAGGGGDGGS